MMLSAKETALARHYTYALFSRLFVEGVTAELRPYLSPIPELAGSLPHPFDADETAVVHHHLFQLNLFPYESIFLATDGLLGGPVTNRVQTQYEQSGFDVDTSAISADHFGYELGFLSFLCGAEADAWEDRWAETAVLIQQRQQTFLQQHLLTWLAPFVPAVRAQQHPFFTALADLTLAFVADHAAIFGALTSDLTLPEMPDLLDNDKTGLKEIAAFLLTPSYSGVFFSRDQISGIARQQQLPHGFGNRTQMMTNLMKTAVQYDLFSALITAIQAVISSRRKHTMQMVADNPPLKPFFQPWQDRCQASHQLLAEIKSRSVMTS